MDDFDNAVDKICVVHLFMEEHYKKITIIKTYHGNSSSLHRTSNNSNPTYDPVIYMKFSHIPILSVKPLMGDCYFHHIVKKKAHISLHLDIMRIVNPYHEEKEEEEEAMILSLILSFFHSFIYFSSKDMGIAPT